MDEHNLRLSRTTLNHLHCQTWADKTLLIVTFRLTWHSYFSNAFQINMTYVQNTWLLPFAGIEKALLSDYTVEKTPEGSVLLARGGEVKRGGYD
jgi:hypothetical protein